MCKISDAFKAKLLDAHGNYKWITDLEYMDIVRQVWDETQPEGITPDTYKAISAHLMEFGSTFSDVSQHRQMSQAEADVPENEFVTVGKYNFVTGPVIMSQRVVEFRDKPTRCVHARTTVEFEGVGMTDNDYITEHTTLWDF